MEIPVVLGPGGGRDASSITSASATAIDLSAFVGHYVEIEANQASLLSFIPSSGTFTFSTSGAVAMSLQPTSGAIVDKKVAANTAIHRYVCPTLPRLLVQAQATSITEVSVKLAQRPNTHGV